MLCGYWLVESSVAKEHVDKCRCRIFAGIGEQGGACFVRFIDVEAFGYEVFRGGDDGGDAFFLFGEVGFVAGGASCGPLEKGLPFRMDVDAGATFDQIGDAVAQAVGYGIAHGVGVVRVDDGTCLKQ